MAPPCCRSLRLQRLQRRPRPQLFGLGDDNDKDVLVGLFCGE
jgi:hypothetical protein